MHILEHTKGVGRWNESQVLLHPTAPELRKVTDPELTLGQPDLEFDPQHDVQVVGGFVCLDANERGLHLINGSIETLGVHPSELRRKARLQRGEEMLPEPARSA